ncbi:MAG: tRNA (5-methylaminomethyl-2-thiouridine)(34)-methyltransferase MnmD [Salaquimonas sp.]
MPENKSKIEWTEDDIPVSTQFDDPYYSKADGLLETLHVFINGNNLPARWANMQACTIAELGFGTGLNFLVTIKKWLAIAPENSRLHFISFEQYPLDGKQILRALSCWPELTKEANILATVWQQALDQNEHKIEIAWSAQITLTVFLDDANKTLPRQTFLADAWYLDGFSPAKNPELWGLELMQNVSNRTAAKGSFATYTAAGWVRRNLQSVGFEVSRIPGHAGKRQMSIGFKSKSNQR